MNFTGELILNKKLAHIGITKIEDSQSYTCQLKIKSPESQLSYSINRNKLAQTYLNISYNNDILVLPITEIVTDNEFFDYNAKYKGEADEITPARISYQMTLRIKSIAKKIYEILDMKGFSRSEFIIQNDEIFLLEVNSVPGLTNESILPKQANAAGIELKDLFSNAINEAIN